MFEVTETHKATDINHLKGILSFYRTAGFQVALEESVDEKRKDSIKASMAPLEKAAKEMS